MQQFHIKNPSDWRPTLTTEVLKLEAPSGKRIVRFTVNTTDACAVFVADNPKMTDQVLVASCNGMFEVSYASTGTTYVQCVTDEGGLTYLKTHTGLQARAPVEVPSFTSVMPKNRRNTEMDRMIMAMNVNQKRRDAQMQYTIARIEKAAAAAASVSEVLESEEPDPKTNVTNENDGENDENGAIEDAEHETNNPEANT